MRDIPPPARLFGSCVSATNRQCKQPRGESMGRFAEPACRRVVDGRYRGSAQRNHPRSRMVNDGGKHALIVDGAAVPDPRRAGQQQQQLPGDAAASLADHPAAPRQHARDPGRLGADRAATKASSISPSSTRCSRRRAQNDVRLVLLWFGTWKNTGPQLHAGMGEVATPGASRA